ncbi:MAG: hypothetical protein U0794_11505 [Isosphaeraceae bacterium]
MSIRFACPHCGKSFVVSSTNAGRRGRCSQCREEFTVPMPAEARAVPGDTAFTGPSAEGPEAAAPMGEAYDVVPVTYEVSPGAETRDALPDAPRVKKPKKRRRTTTSTSSIEPGQFAHLRKPLSVVAVVGVLLFALSLVVPVIAIWVGVVFSLAGILLVFGGMALGAYIAFTEDFVHGFFFVVLPIYAAYYFMSRWDDTKVALGVVIGGLVILAAGGWALEYGQASRPRPEQGELEVGSRNDPAARAWRLPVIPSAV